MKRKSRLTYAQRAKQIAAKYKRRLGENFEHSDPMTEAAMQKELDALMEEQEASKASIVENKYQEMPEQMSVGGPLDDDYFSGYSAGDGFPADVYQHLYNGVSNPNYTAPIQKLTPKQGYVSNPTQPLRQRGTLNFGATNGESDPSWWSQIPLESKIGSGVQLAGALASGLIGIGNKPRKMKFNPVSTPSPDLVTNDEQLAQATRAYRGMAGNMRYLSPSQYMAAMNSLASQEAATKAGIVEQTKNTNAGITNDWKWKDVALKQANEQGRLGVDQYNEANRQSYLSNIGQTVANTAGVVSGFMRDELARKNEQDALSFRTQPSYGKVTVNNRTVRTTIPAPGFEFYNHPSTKQAVYMVYGQEVSPAMFKIELDNYWKNHPAYTSTNPKED